MLPQFEFERTAVAADSSHVADGCHRGVCLGGGGPSLQCGGPLAACRIAKPNPTPSFPILSHPIPSYLIPSHPIISHPISSYPILSYHIPSYHIPSNPILSHPIPSYPILSHPIPSHPSPSYHISSYPILSHPIPSILIEHALLPLWSQTMVHRRFLDLKLSLDHEYGPYESPRVNHGGDM